MNFSCPTTLDEEIRKLKRRPTLHPHSPRLTQAGPVRHDLLPNGRGRVWCGMRKYGYIEIEMFDLDAAMKRIGLTKPRWWWRTDPDYDRVVRALARYRIDKYARDIQNAIITAWRA